MRFNLLLHINKSGFGDKIPINYAYELSSLVYRVLSKSDNDFSQWLHENGFQLGNKKFKLFTFSRLHVPSFRIEGEFMHILSDTVEWQISFLPERSTQKFISGVFQNQTFDLGTRQANVRFHVCEISVIPLPVFTETMTYRTLSPVCLALKQKKGYEQYISPAHPEAQRLIRLNLLDKYKASTGDNFPISDFPFEIDVLDEPKSSLITIKANTPEESRVRGFMCRFTLTAPVELQKILYESGCGGKNSQGFGMVEADTLR